MIPEVIATERVVKVKKIQGRTTHWSVTCPDGCQEVIGVKPKTRAMGAWFAQDHLIQAHDGEGSIRVGR